jgi:hypothetical protein
MPREKADHGFDSGRLKFHQNFEFSYGDWLINRCLQGMLGVTDTWLIPVLAPYVASRTPGDIPS